MSRILVIGAYGGFGARLCRRLAARGHRLIVAGRSLARAQRFCRDFEGAEPLALDREGDVAAALAELRPALVIDAAGPFQGSSYAVPEACIAVGIHYLDLADARGFVVGIGALDAAARSAGVAVIAGASTSPALTSAVARALAAGMERVDAVDIALSAANRPEGGEAVLAAALSCAGQPIRLWRSGRWTQAWAWDEMRREDFLFADGTGLTWRLVGLADLPDCELLQAELPGRPEVAFRAGTELGFQMRALWLASRLVRLGRRRSLIGARPWIAALYRLTARIGGARSAMSVTVSGLASDQPVERRWTVVAERGDGLEIPTLTAEILAGDIIAGRLPPGAYGAAGLLSLDRYEPLFATLAVRHETRERELPPPLYERLLGPGWHRLPSAVRAMHAIGGSAEAAGVATVRRGKNRPARLIGAAMRMPPEGSWPLHVSFEARGGTETWTRDFGGHRFSSELVASGLRLVERFGPLRFHFDLPAGDSGLEMRLCGWSAFRIPLPRALGPRIAAREHEEQGRFRFDVRVALPLIGEIVHYCGWLSRVGPPQAPAERRAAA